MLYAAVSYRVYLMVYYKLWKLFLSLCVFIGYADTLLLLQMLSSFFFVFQLSCVGLEQVSKCACVCVPE